MPHLVIERIRQVPKLCQGCMCCIQPGKRTGVCAVVLECFDILGGVIFVIGSVCFLPPYSEEIEVFLLGCALYIVGGLIYLGICCFTLAEACREKGYDTLEACENMLYVLGSLIFVVGTILYYPPEAHHSDMNWFVRTISVGVYFNMFSPEFEGTILFIVGSFMFAFAAFVNGLNQRSFDSVSNQLLTATTSLYMMGSLLFVMGSVAFLPDLGCNETMIIFGAWSFIIGSMFYVVGSSVSMWRTIRELRNPVHDPFLAPDSKSPNINPRAL